MRNILTLLLVCYALSQPIIDMQTIATTYIVQDTANYTFTLGISGDFVSNYTVPSGSDFIIHFPQEYPLLPANNHVCAIISWPTAYGNITCSLAYQTLTISNAFSTPLVIEATTLSMTIKVIVHGVENPTYAQTSSAFSGAFQFNNSLLFPAFGPNTCLLYTSPSPRDQRGSRMPSSA